MQTVQTELSSFEWDETKRQANILKHGIDFEDAVLALQEPRVEMRSDKNGESRILAICPDGEMLIAVIYTTRRETCRIISVRAARKNEKTIYNQGIGRRDPRETGGG